MIQSSRRPRHPPNGAAVVLVLAMVGTGMSRPAGIGGIVSAQTLNPCTLVTKDDVQSLSASRASPTGSRVRSRPSAPWPVDIRGVSAPTVQSRCRRERCLPYVPRHECGPDQTATPRVGQSRDGRCGRLGYRRSRRLQGRFGVVCGCDRLSKGRVVEVQADGFVARERKDQVIALLKSAVSRLQ